MNSKTKIEKNIQEQIQKHSDYQWRCNYWTSFSLPLCIKGVKFKGFYRKFVLSAHSRVQICECDPSQTLLSIYFTSLFFFLGFFVCLVFSGEGMVDLLIFLEIFADYSFFIFFSIYEFFRSRFQKIFE